MIGLEGIVLFVFLLPIWILIRIIVYIANKIRKKEFSLKREILLNLFFIYILSFLGVTLFPLIIDFNVDSIYFSVNTVPIINIVKEIINIFKDGMDSFMLMFWIRNILGNLILLFPFGIIVPMLWNKFNNGFKIVLFAFSISLSIEVLQLLSMYVGNRGRICDVDDVLLNTIGAYIGYVFYKKVIKSKFALLKNKII